MFLCRVIVSIVSLVAVAAQDSSNVTAANITSAANVTSASSPAARIPVAPSLACAAIRLALGSSIVESSGPEYDATATGPWSLFNSLDRPTCIVYPRTALHVQIAMGSIFLFKSHYAVQAGAHSGMVGWNSITKGVLISFSHMVDVSYNSATDTITLQPGVHFGDAMTAVQSYGVSVIGGRAKDIGTGLLLGGGISFVSPLYGWSADLIKEMDVVLVDGQLVTATATNTYSDLFIALKGGANRFGIYPGSSSVALSNASAKYIREVSQKLTHFTPGLIVLMNTINLAAADANIIYLFYKGTSLPTTIFGDFLSIPSTSQSLSPLSYFDIEALIDGSARGNGQQFGASSWVGDEATFLNGYNHLINFTTTFETQLSAAYMIISPIPRSQWTAAGATTPNAIGNPGVAYATINFNLIYPSGVTIKPPNVNAGFKFLLSQTPPSPGLPLYINECDASQHVYATYPNFATLQTTYHKYDPTRFNVKHTAGPIGL
ncbi:FAD-binding domain-containing protein [Mycena epipterygia]|nr:FAD-binding domain-containing protein [Mycena epipterygia]